MNATSKMQLHALEQGSAAWLAHRIGCNNASDAPAMLGCSPYTSRSALIARLHTGLVPEVDAATQRRYDDGHRTEALLRPHAEALIGEELYPVVGTRDWPGITRPLGASYDGLTMARRRSFECKRLNDELRAALPHGAESMLLNQQANMPKYHRVQVEQQFMVCPTLELTLFGAAEFDRDGNLVDVRWCWCKPDPELRAEIVGGWIQFEADLAAYTPPEKVAAVVVASPVQALPAVAVQVAGEIAIRHNFDAFEVALRDFLEHRLIRQPKTDQDFADLDVQIKAMKGAESALESAETNWIAQIEAVGNAKRTKDMLHKLVRDNRLMAEKLLSSEKERRRGEIVAAGISALREHVDGWNTRLGKPYMPTIAADFAGAIRGKKSLANMEDAVSVELARAKVAADQAGAGIQVNLSALRELARDHAFLFADTAQLVLKAPEDCRAVITARIAEHKEAEERRAAELAERERERIRREEADRLQREQQARQIEEHQQRVAAEQEQRRQQAEKEVATRSQSEERQLPPASTPAVDPDPFTASAGNVVPMRISAPAAQPATLTLGTICQRLGFTMTADFVRRLGIEPAATEKAAKLYTEAQFQLICEALVAHVRTVSVQQKVA